MDALTTLRPAPLLVILLVELVLIGWGTGYVTSALFSLVPWRPLSYPILLPGTVLHELAHAIAALALGLGIEEMVLFKPTLGVDGSVLLGWVTSRRTTPARSAVMAAAPVLLVPPMLLALAWVAANLAGTYWEASALLWLVVGLGSLGAFPSSGDRIPLLGGLLALAVCVAVGLGILMLAGERGLSVVLAGAVVALLVPALLFAIVFWVAWGLHREDEGRPPMFIVIRDRPRGTPTPPRPQWRGPQGRG